MHIESLKDRQKSSFYIAKFGNVIGEWGELKKAGINYNYTAYSAYRKSKASEQEVWIFP